MSLKKASSLWKFYYSYLHPQNEIQCTCMAGNEPLVSGAYCKRLLRKVPRTFNDYYFNDYRHFGTVRKYMKSQSESG